MKKFVTWYDDRIDPTEIESETKEFVIIDGRRSKKMPERSDDIHFHDTYEAARSFLRADAQHKIIKASEEMKKQQERLSRIELMGEET
jgi:hypothetical protein